MFCSKCGKELVEGASFCPGCGISVAENQSYTGVNDDSMGNVPAMQETGKEEERSSPTVSQPTPDQTAVKKKSSYVPFVIGGVVAVLVLSIVVTGIFVLSDPQRKYDKQLSLGEKYFDELDYDRAIAAYRAAIEIDPKNPDAYEALAEIYMECGEPEEALAVLQEGIDETEDERLEELYAQVEEQASSAALTADDADDDDGGNTDENTRASDGDEDDADDAGNAESPAGDGSYARNGDYVIFGSYEQDGDTSNGPEPIEWEVLDKSDGKLLLISRYILDCPPYNTEDADVTWETCTLRNWLNNDFYNTAFSTAEKDRVITANLSNPDNAYWGTEGGNDTNDKVFCLSMEEVRKYYSFESWYDDDQSGYSSALMTDVTPYAVNNGARQFTITQEDYTGEGYEDRTGLSEEGYDTDVIGLDGGFWWLRSPGGLSNIACTVKYNGYAGWLYYYNVDYAFNGVRPALYLEK
ncbi:MAG: DUF6273 domain-containing protein [Lachnospiraceae bacterium]|nr:DUF6273 domain-containing protein [Lachnospiraceae bacterium]